METIAANRRRLLGQWGESAAADFLRGQGLVVLVAGYRCARGEIDLVCRDANQIVFVEVKTRLSRAAGLPEEAVTKSKQRRLRRVAQYFLREHRLEHLPWRFDVVAVEIGLVGPGERVHPQIRHHRTAFHLDS